MARNAPPTAATNAPMRPDDDLDLDDAHAEGPRRRLAVPDGPKGQPGGRPAQVDDEGGEDQEHDQGQVAEGQVPAGDLRSVERHAQPTLRELVQGEDQGLDEKPETEGDQGHIEVAQSDRQQADDRTDDGHDDPGEDDGQQNRDMPDRHQLGRGKAPPPAKMICDSHSIPPSPVTTVNERKAMA